MARFDLIAFDADDTLWENEHLFIEAQGKFKALLSKFHPPEWIAARLYETEMRNMQHFGYGIKAFALSMIETALDLTEDRVSGAEVRAMIDAAKAMLAADVTLLEHTAPIIESLASRYPLMVITKGDLRDQHVKMTRSGLGTHFVHVEVVSEKSAGVYEAILQRHRVSPDRFLMIGNSLRSDVLPVLALGGNAVYVPHSLTWAHEAAEAPRADVPGYFEIPDLAALPALIDRLEAVQG
ncbi:MAG: HAD family hydrolase [Acidobacteriota bacterium]